MVLPQSKCNDCAPSYLQRRPQASTAIIFSCLPFIVTFVLVATIVFQRLFPLLSGDERLRQIQNGLNGAKLSHALFSPRSPSPPKSTHEASISPVKRFSALAFSTTISLAAVLAELILCEISNTVDPIARGLALRAAVFVLLIFLIIIIPSLEIQSVISAAGWRYTGRESGRLKIAWILQVFAFGCWILAFWWSGQLFLTKHHREQQTTSRDHPIDIVVEHVGVIGISLMALLSGFACASAPWQSFGARQKPVTEEALARKQAGLDATNDMLQMKRSRLRALQLKIDDAPTESFLQKAMGSIRGNASVTERKNLEMEISGLENMRASLSSQHSLFVTRMNQQHRSQTFSGRLLLVGSYLFSTYCLYRIMATSITALRRYLTSSGKSFVGSDPINNILAILVEHYDSDLDRDAWLRQISFLLSGVMLGASFSSVLQTFHFFARFTPSLLKATQANLPLIVAQVCGTYVISVSLLLRGIMPGQVVSDQLKNLGGNDMIWVDGWFEAWFLGGVLITACAIWASRKITGADEWGDDIDDDDVEVGKRS